jgi:hypothetical protein
MAAPVGGCTQLPSRDPILSGRAWAPSSTGGGYRAFAACGARQGRLRAQVASRPANDPAD